MTQIQSIIFDKKYYTLEESERFLKNHNINPIKEVDITTKYYRYRLKVPNTRIYRYRLKNLSNGVKLIYEERYISRPNNINNKIIILENKNPSSI